MRIGIGVSVILMLIANAGCSGAPADEPNLVPATGTVLYNNKPVSGANITFIVDKAPIATGSTDADGKFSLTTGGRPGAPLGNAKVSISKVSATQENLTSMTPQDMANMAAQGQKAIGTTVEEIPSKYNSPEKSGLVATLDEDGSKNVFEFRLVD